MIYINDNVDKSDIEYKFGSRVYKKYLNGNIEDICIVTTKGNLVEIEDASEKIRVNNLIKEQLNETINEYCVNRELNIGCSSLQTVNGLAIGYYVDKDNFKDLIHCLYQDADLKIKKQFYEAIIPCSSNAHLDSSDCIPDNPKNIEYAIDFMQNEDFIKIQDII